MILNQQYTTIYKLFRYPPDIGLFYFLRSFSLSKLLFAILERLLQCINSHKLFVAWNGYAIENGHGLFQLLNFQATFIK